MNVHEKDSNIYMNDTKITYIQLKQVTEGHYAEMQQLQESHQTDLQQAKEGHEAEVRKWSKGVYSMHSNTIST